MRKFELLTKEIERKNFKRIDGVTLKQTSDIYLLIQAILRKHRPDDRACD
jgi:hypothetical protein